MSDIMERLDDRHRRRGHRGGHRGRHRERAARPGHGPRGRPKRARPLVRHGRPHLARRGSAPWRAVVGQWRSGPDGEIVEWQDNEEYRPSPTALGWPELTDDADAVVQLAVTEALAELPEAAVFVTPDAAPLTATAPDGEIPVVPLFTSSVHLHTAGGPAFELMSVAALARGAR